MLVNQMHQGGIRALLAYDGSLFSGMQLPDGVDREDVVDRIIYKYGDTPLMTPDPEVIKFYIARWSKRRLPLWEKYKEIIELEYDPISNYDRKELTTETNEYEKANTGTVEVDNTGTVVTADTGTVTTTNKGDVTDKRAADNSSTWENYDQSSQDTEAQTTNALDNTVTNDLNQKTTNDLQEQGGHTTTRESRISGNIGVTTSQQMQAASLDLIPRFDIIEHIADDWHSEFCLYIYS